MTHNQKNKPWLQMFRDREGDRRHIPSVFLRLHFRFEDVFAGVGFEDCSAEVTEIEDTDFIDGLFTAPHNSIKSGLWQFFAFHIVKDDIHIVIQTVLETQDGG